MAIAEIKELFEASGEWTLGAENKRQRNYSRKFLVRCDSVTDSPIDIMLDKRLPQLGVYYAVGDSYDTTSVVTHVVPKRENNNAKHWTIDVKYEILEVGDPKQPEQQDPKNKADPRNWSPEISTSWVKFQTPTFVDVNGNQIVNSCGDLFNPPINVDDDRLQVKISRFEKWLNLTTALKYKNTINSDTFWGVPAGCWKMLPISASQEIINDPKTGINWVFFKKTYTLELNVNGWGARPLDRGLNRLGSRVTSGGTFTGVINIPPSSGDDPTTFERVPITTAYGTPHTTPQLLNGHGQPNPLNAAPVWVAFATGDPPPNGARLADGYQIYKSQNFGNLNLPPIDVGINVVPAGGVAGIGGAGAQGLGGGGSYY